MPLICSLSVSLEEIVLQSTEIMFITRGGSVSKKLHPLCLGSRLPYFIKTFWAEALKKYLP